jgi:hypothetical protein
MKVPDRVYVLGYTYTCHTLKVEACCFSSNLRFNLYCLSYSAFFCFRTNSVSEDVEAYCCVRNLRFILYCLSYSAFFCFSANYVSVEVEVCRCISNLRFNLYCLMRYAFFRFLTASMSASTILVTRYYNNKRHSGLLLFSLFPTPPTTRPHTCAYVMRMKDNVSRSFEMRHVIHDIRISSRQWPRCDVTYGAARCPRSYEISPG